MSDLDFGRSFEEGFQIEISDNPGKISGNRLLVNIFEITFMTERKRFFMEDSTETVENFGGNAFSHLGSPRVLSDVQAIAASINIVTNQTVKDMKADEKNNTPATERIDKAEVLSVDTVDGVVTATIRIYPVETERYADLIFNLPIVRA